MAYKNAEKRREYDKRYYFLHKENIKERQKKFRAQHCKENYNRVLKQRYGGQERYDEAMQKYDGWCAFACDKQAKTVHHMNGKSIHNSPKEKVNNDLSNLLPLCLSCHSRLHKKKPKYDYKEKESGVISR